MPVWRIASCNASALIIVPRIPNNPAVARSMPAAPPATPLKILPPPITTASCVPSCTTSPIYKRVLLKLSGEALMGDDAFGINRATIERIVADIAEVVQLGTQLAVVIGGGNIFRGVAGGAAGMDRATADYMGMLGTMINALALQDAMRQTGIEARVQSALRMDQVAEPYIRPRAI